jgi:hypothetical protein
VCQTGLPVVREYSRRTVCIRPSCTPLPVTLRPRSESRIAVRWCTSVRAAKLLYPRGPRSGPGYAVPVHHHLPGPIRPTHRHSTTSPHSGLYALPSLCARLRRLGDPRVVPCFRWHPFSTCRPPGPREAQRLHIPSSFAADAGLRLKGKVSALPTSPHSDSRGGVQFRGFTTVRFRCDLSICSPSCRS